MSITTAPVTAGGSTWCTKLRPCVVHEHADRGEHEAGDQDRARHVGGVAAVRPDRGNRRPTNDALVPR